MARTVSYQGCHLRGVHRLEADAVHLVHEEQLIVQTHQPTMLKVQNHVIYLHKHAAIDDPCTLRRRVWPDVGYHVLAPAIVAVHTIRMSQAPAQAAARQRHGGGHGASAMQRAVASAQLATGYSERAPHRALVCRSTPNGTAWSGSVFVLICTIATRSLSLQTAPTGCAAGGDTAREMSVQCQAQRTQASVPG